MANTATNIQQYLSELLSILQDFIRPEQVKILTILMERQLAITIPLPLYFPGH
jgi:hypothetical protein